MSKKDFNTNTANNPEWLTPLALINALGPFDLDPCAPTPETRPWATAFNHYCIRDNGLVQPWDGFVWCNPPYGGETFDWLRRLHAHGNGIGLIFARTETKGFHDVIWNKADAIFFFKGRLKFCYISGEEAGTSNAPSCLVAYGPKAVQSISSAQKNGLIVGKLILLK